MKDAARLALAGRAAFAAGIGDLSPNPNMGSKESSLGAVRVGRPSGEDKLRSSF